MPGPKRQREVKVHAFPEKLYQMLRDRVDAEDSTNREMLRRAVRENLATVERLLKDAGFAPAEGKRHLVRAAIDVDLLKQLRDVANRSGVDASTLAFLCLRHFLGVRLDDPNRAALLQVKLTKRAKKRKKRASA